MNMALLHQEDDDLITGFLAAERQFLTGGDVMSQESWFVNKQRLAEMREKMADDLVRMDANAKLELQDARDAAARASTRAERVEEQVRAAAVARAEEAKRVAQEAAEHAAAKAEARAARIAAVKNGVRTGFGKVKAGASKVKNGAASLADHAMHGDWAVHSDNLHQTAHGFEASAEATVKNAPRFKWHGPALALAGVTYLAAFGLLVGGVAVGMVKLLKARNDAKATKAEIVSEIRKEISKASKPGMKVTMEGGDSDKLGKLMVNGRPASQVREELEKLLKSDKTMTPEEYARAVQTVHNGGHQFLQKLDALNQTAQTYQNTANLATGGIVGMYVVFGALAFVCWLGYRVYQFLIRKLS